MEKLKTYKYQIFISVFFLYFIPKYLEYTTFVNINGVQTVITVAKTLSYILAIAVGILNIFERDKDSRGFLVVISSLFIYFVYQGFVKDEKSIFVVLILSSIFEMDFIERYIRDVLVASIALYVTTVAACKLGVIENIYTIREKFGMPWEAGGNGFTYSGQMIMMLIPIVLLYYYHRKEKIRWFETLAWVAINCWVFMKCLTIMGFALILLFIAVYNIVVFVKKEPIRRLLDANVVKYTPFIFLTITIALLLVYKYIPAIGMPLDTIVNGRLNIGNIIIKAYGIKLFGTDFVNNTTHYYEILDSEYLQMLVGAGILYLAIAMVLCMWIVRYSQRLNNPYMTLIWIFILFNAIFNNGIFNLVMNPFGIILTVSIKDKFTKRKTKETPISASD